MKRTLQSLVVELQSNDWRRRIAAIELAVELGEVRLRGRLRLLSRFHVAPHPVRQAAARAVCHLDGIVAESRGRLSHFVSDPPTGRVSVPPEGDP